MSISPSDIQVVLPMYNAEDVFRKIGGIHSNQQISSDVDSIFQPGIVLGSDASDDYSYQYRKVFIKNQSSSSIYNTKVWGYNIKNRNFVKFALERDVLGSIKIDGSEIIKDYRTAPSMYNYEYTEVGSDDAFLIGTLPSKSGQGIWLRQKIEKNSSDIATDTFILDFEWTEVE